MTLRMLILLPIVLALAAVMTMTGRGGGNFYVPLLVAAGQPMHNAAASGQFILMSAAFTGMLLFHKHKKVDWKLALVIDPPTDVMAFVGGYFSYLVSGVTLKFMLSGLLLAAALCMLLKVRERPMAEERRFGFWQRRFGDHEYVVNLWLALPITAAVGFAAGAVGISGGSFKVPLMVLLCGVPMDVVAITALMGFLGHTGAGHFELHWAVPAACFAVLGSIIGARKALKTKPKALKTVFALTTLAAAIFMVINALLT